MDPRLVQLGQVLAPPVGGEDVDVLRADSVALGGRTARHQGDGCRGKKRKSLWACVSFGKSAKDGGWKIRRMSSIFSEL